MTDLSKTRLVVVDTETFGLDPDQDPVIEIGILIATIDFRIIDRFSTTIWTNIHVGAHQRIRRQALEGDRGAKIVLDMHEKSGLFEQAAREQVSIAEAERRTLDFLASHAVEGNDPMVGSSVGFDRGMLHAQHPEIESKFHYRNIDISTLKELCLRFTPSMAAKVHTAWVAKKAHRVLDDCEDSLHELQFYYENFLFVE